MIGVEMRNIDVGQVLAHRYDFGHHAVGVAEKLGGVDQNGIVLTIDESRVAVETEIAVEKNFEFEWHRCSFGCKGVIDVPPHGTAARPDRTAQAWWSMKPVPGVRAAKYLKCVP